MGLFRKQGKSRRTSSGRGRVPDPYLPASSSPEQDIRDTLVNVCQQARITIDPADEGLWKGAGLGMSPFPARVTVDDSAATLWSSVFVAKIDEPDIDADVAAVPFPTPRVTLRLDVDPYGVEIAYPLAFAAASTAELQGWLGAGPMFAVGLARQLGDRMTPGWRTHLESNGVTLAGRVKADPRDLLRGPVLSYPSEASDE